MRKSHAFKLKLILTLILTIDLMLCVFLCFFSKKTEYTTYSVPEVKHMNAVGTASTLTSDTLLENSTLDTLQLNFTTLPEITVNTDYTYVVEGEDGVARSRPQLDEGPTSPGYQPIKSVTFSNLPYDQFVDIEVIAKFNNCGTLNGKNIDIVIKYSDFYSAYKYTGTSPYYQSRNNSKVIWWTAYGTIDNQTAYNEWFQRGFQNINMDVYFYYHGETTPIPLNIAYLTLYSEDVDEAASSSVAKQSYVFEDTTMGYQLNLTLGNKTYNNIFYGTASSDSKNIKKAAVSFKYEDTDHIDVDIQRLNETWSAGYHINFYAMSATLPGNPVKSVSSEKINVGEELTYTVDLGMPSSTDNSFLLSSFVFEDTIDTTNLTYKSLNVYNENGVDITSMAGSKSYTNGKISYTFNSAYLQSINYSGQMYKYIIKADVKTDDLTSSQIDNTCTATFNTSNILTSNTVTTNVVSQLTVKYVDEDNEDILEPIVTQLNVFEEYQTEQKEIDKYEFVSVTDNASGTVGIEDIEVVYTYKALYRNIQVIKLWNDNNDSNRPTSVNFSLWKRESTLGSMGTLVETVAVTSNDGWTHTFEDLPRFDDSGNEIQYYAYESDWTSGYYVSNMTTVDDVITVTNSKYGTITINKFDNSTKEPLSGAKFTVEMKYGNYWTPITWSYGTWGNNSTTDANGQLIVGNLRHGTYRITESTAPDGYGLNDESFEVTIDAENISLEIDVPNKKTVSLPATGGEGIIFFTTIGGILVFITTFINTRTTRIKNKKRKCKLKHRY